MEVKFTAIYESPKLNIRDLNEVIHLPLVGWRIRPKYPKWYQVLFWKPAYLEVTLYFAEDTDAISEETSGEE